MDPIREIPKFEPEVDPKLLAGLTDEKVFLICEMSKIRQGITWTQQRLVELVAESLAHGKSLRELSDDLEAQGVRIGELEKLRDRVMQPLGWIIGLGGIAVTAVITAVITKWIG